MSTATAPEELRRDLADQLTDIGAIRSPRWHDAFATVPRESFVPAFTIRTPGGLRAHHHGNPDWLPTVYTDASLLTRFDAHGTAVSSSSQPSVMARMLEALDVADGDRVLEIGTGTGYNAALLSHRLGSHNVYSLDVDPALVAAARTALDKAGHAPALTAGDGTQGWPERAPYDALIATCGVHRIPDAWRQQVRPGGRIVANIGLGIVRLTVAHDHSAGGRFLPSTAAFMTARPAVGDEQAPAARLTADLTRATGRTRHVPATVEITEQMPQFLASVAQPDVDHLVLVDEDGRQVRYLVHQATSSWARLTPGPNGTAQLEHGGPRDLWAELEPLLTAWVEAEKPSMDQYQLHVGHTGGHLLVLGADSWLLRSVAPIV